MLFSRECASRAGWSVPAFQQDQLVWIHGTLEHLELLAAGFAHHFRAARLNSSAISEPLPGCRGDGHNQTDRHRISS